MHYVGMDCHITTLDFAVVDDAGRLVKSCKVDTSAKNFMEFVKSVAAPRIVYTEESALAAWALETCIRFGEKLVITDPKQNHWIGSSTQKDDPLDAFKLAQLGRGGFIKVLPSPGPGLIRKMTIVLWNRRTGLLCAGSSGEIVTAQNSLTKHSIESIISCACMSISFSRQ